MSDFHTYKALKPYELSSCDETYAVCVGEGFDYWQEALKWQPKGEFCLALERAKKQAQLLKGDLTGQIEFKLGAEVFSAFATGAKGGIAWRLGNDDFLLLIGSPEREWTISIRYLAAGLWEHGMDNLRLRALTALWPVTHHDGNNVSGDNLRVTRIDWCWDFFSPSFTKEFRPGGMMECVVAPSGVKTTVEDGYAAMWGKRTQGETLTLGTKSTLQVQLYDKTKEITEASGKTWFYGLWRQNAGRDIFAEMEKPRHVWRLECRWSREFLRERNIRYMEDVPELLPRLIAEALLVRRFTIGGSDDVHAFRWPLHPLWSEAFRRSAAERQLVRQRYVVGTRQALFEQAIKQVAGSLRGSNILDDGEPSTEQALKLAQDAVAYMFSDPKHAQKVKALQERYRFVDEAK